MIGLAVQNRAMFRLQQDNPIFARFQQALFDFELHYKIKSKNHTHKHVFFPKVFHCQRVKVEHFGVLNIQKHECPMLVRLSAIQRKNPDISVEKLCVRKCRYELIRKRFVRVKMFFQCKGIENRASLP